MLRTQPIRRFPRAHSEHPALVRLLGGPRFEDFARTQTLGLGGCMFVSRASLGYGSLMELLIALEGRVVKTDARVVYEHPKGDDRLEVGVEFLRVSATDRALIESLVARKRHGNGASHDPVPA